MTRTTISLSEELRERVRVCAAERGVSMAELIREAIEEKVAASRPKPQSIGVGASGYTDTARNHDELLEPSTWR